MSTARKSQRRLTDGGGVVPLALAPVLYRPADPAPTDGLPTEEQLGGLPSHLTPPHPIASNPIASRPQSVSDRLERVPSCRQEYPTCQPAETDGLRCQRQSRHSRSGRAGERLQSRGAVAEGWDEEGNEGGLTRK